LEFLIYFLLGVAFNGVVMPLLDSLLSWVSLKIEYKKALITEKINESSIRVQLAIDSAEEAGLPKHHPVGFCVSTEEYEEDEEDE
jgi:hypothetical protein